MSQDYDIPAYGWKPRPYQYPAWRYLQLGGRHAELICHRRWGKDELALHHAAICTYNRPGTYWHMLPKANQVRKAIWKAINPHTGRRRIEDAFPERLFKWNDQEMMVTNRQTGATWQCLGSDNFQGAIGSPPVGIVYSEWALANPYAAGYLSPILAENEGWELYITTPRGKNHAHGSYLAARENMRLGHDGLPDPDYDFAEIQDVYHTGAVSAKELLKDLVRKKAIYGEENGLALWQQEWECDFEAAIIGAYYSSEFKDIDRSGRIKKVPHDPNWPVHVAMDIGRKDATCMWFWQNVHGVPKVIDMWAESFRDPDYICSVITGIHTSINIIGDAHSHRSRLEVEKHGPMLGYTHHHAYEIGSVWIPHDGAAKTFAAKGKSVEEQLWAVFGSDKVHKVPGLSIQDGIQATRKFLSIAEFDEGVSTEELRQYRREWDDDKRRFRDHPLHDYASDFADAARYMAIANTRDILPKELETPRYETDRSFDELVKLNRKRRLRQAAR